MTSSSAAPEKNYKICILAYSRVTAIAREVVRELSDSDIDYIIMESSLSDQAACVAEAIRLGCEVFVSGPVGAVVFAHRYNYPVIPFQVRDIDYLNAIRKALNEGHQHIGIIHYRYAPIPNLKQYQYLMQTDLQELVFDEVPQIYNIAKSTACDMLIGPAVVRDAADAAGKDSLLIYAGKEAIRDACLRAGETARTLYAARRSHTIAESILDTTQLGIIVTSTDNTIEFFNHTMQNYTGLALHQVSGRPLTDVFPNLPLARFLQSGYTQSDSYHLINSVMMRCVFRRLTIGSHDGGVLLTVHPNPHNRKKDRKQPSYTVAPVYRLEKITAASPAMNEVVHICRQISPVEYPVMLLGPAGCGREELAHCLHNASKRAGKPCVTIDCATIIDERAVETLYGCSYGKTAVEGLLLTAAGGSIIIKHPELAGPRLQAILQDILTRRQYFRPGMDAPVTLDLSIYTVASSAEYLRLPPGLRRLLSILVVTVPPLCQRQEDIGLLFTNYVRQQLAGRRVSILDEAMEQLLTAYSWPGNVVELRAASTRYAVLLKSAVRPSSRYKYKLLLEAIGHDALTADILARHPVLTQRPVKDRQAFCAAVQTMHALFKDTYEETAARLHLSRTTLWRLLHTDKESEKEK